MLGRLGGRLGAAALDLARATIRRARVTSPTANPAMTAAKIAWVPVSSSASRRSWGKPLLPREAGGRPKCRSSTGRSGTSIVVPSKLTTVARCSLAVTASAFSARARGARSRAREIVLEPPLPWVARPLLETANFITIALLPDRIRREYGFSPVPPAFVRRALPANPAGLKIETVHLPLMAAGRRIRLARFPSPRSRSHSPLDRPG